MKLPVIVLIVILVATGLYLQAQYGIITPDELAKQGK